MNHRRSSKTRLGLTEKMSFVIFCGTETRTTLFVSYPSRKRVTNASLRYGPIRRRRNLSSVRTTPLFFDANMRRVAQAKILERIVVGTVIACFTTCSTVWLVASAITYAKPMPEIVVWL